MKENTVALESKPAAERSWRLLVHALVASSPPDPSRRIHGSHRPCTGTAHPALPVRAAPSYSRSLLFFLSVFLSRSSTSYDIVRHAETLWLAWIPSQTFFLAWIHSQTLYCHERPRRTKMGKKLNVQRQAASPLLVYFIPRRATTTYLAGAGAIALASRSFPTWHSSRGPRPGGSLASDN